MSQKFDLDKFKQQARVVFDNVKRKCVYLIDCVNRFGLQGISWWFKTHQQRDVFLAALDRLRQELQKEDVKLLIVEQAFSEFTIPEDDLGHVIWYTDAHNKLIKFEKHLDETSEFNTKLLQQSNE